MTSSKVVYNTKSLINGGFNLLDSLEKKDIQKQEYNTDQLLYLNEDSNKYVNKFLLDDDSSVKLVSFVQSGNQEFGDSFQSKNYTYLKSFSNSESDLLSNKKEKNQEQKYNDNKEKEKVFFGEGESDHLLSSNEYKKKNSPLNNVHEELVSFVQSGNQEFRDSSQPKNPSKTPKKDEKPNSFSRFVWNHKKALAIFFIASFAISISLFFLKFGFAFLLQSNALKDKKTLYLIGIIFSFFIISVFALIFNSLQNKSLHMIANYEDQAKSLEEEIKVLKKEQKKFEDQSSEDTLQKNIRDLYYKIKSLEFNILKDQKALDEKTLKEKIQELNKFKDEKSQKQNQLKLVQKTEENLEKLTERLNNNKDIITIEKNFSKVKLQNEKKHKKILDSIKKFENDLKTKENSSDIKEQLKEAKKNLVKNDFEKKFIASLDLVKKEVFKILDIKNSIDNNLLQKNDKFILQQPKNKVSKESKKFISAILLSEFAIPRLSSEISKKLFSQEQNSIFNKNEIACYEVRSSLNDIIDAINDNGAHCATRFLKHIKTKQSLDRDGKTFITFDSLDCVFENYLDLD